VLLSLDFEAHHQPFGPLFHRWLPDGETDAMEISTGDPGVVLRLWFERCGFVERGFVRFDYDRREVDPEVMRQQTPLHGGPLRGRFELSDVSEDVMVAIRSNNTGDAAYKSFGKRVVNRLLYPLVG
jgi:hypothetical protein